MKAPLQFRAGIRFVGLLPKPMIPRNCALARPLNRHKMRSDHVSLFAQHRVALHVAVLTYIVRCTVTGHGQRMCGLKVRRTAMRAQRLNCKA
jgi:hypothetical protein